MKPGWENLEIDLFTEAVYEKYGYDFSQYALASLKRRVAGTIQKEGLQTVTELTNKVIHSSDFFSRVLDGLTVTVTEMFRDPAVFKCLVEKVFPYLQTFPELKIWHAGCATGAEVYSCAILLKEAGLYSRSLIYGTDINLRALNLARDGILPKDGIEEATKAYSEAGGKFSFSKYYTYDYEAAIFDSTLKKQLVFSDHNLVTDSKFGDMNLIFCRNVLIYFSPSLQKKVLSLFWGSLRNGGFLVLGSKERLDSTRDLSGCYVYAKNERIYQKRA